MPPGGRSLALFLSWRQAASNDHVLQLWLKGSPSDSMRQHRAGPAPRQQGGGGGAQGTGVAGNEPASRRAMWVLPRSAGTPTATRRRRNAGRRREGSHRVGTRRTNGRLPANRRRTAGERAGGEPPAGGWQAGVWPAGSRRAAGERAGSRRAAEASLTPDFHWISGGENSRSIVLPPSGGRTLIRFRPMRLCRDRVRIRTGRSFGGSRRSILPEIE